MGVIGLGYIGIETDNLAEWGGFATDLLGLQRIDKSKSSLAFRMDDRKQRMVVNEGAGRGVTFYGWEAVDASDLAGLAARVETTETSVEYANRALCEERRVRELIHFRDPMGNRVEVFHGPEIASDPFQPGRSISGFRTGVNGMGHVVFTADRGDLVQAMADFYINALGFHLTDYYSNPFEARFLHVNPRHHSLAIVQTGKPSFHHLMMELYSFDDVGQGYDLALEDPDQIAATLGRHTSDYMTSFYTWTPSKFMIEYGWGGRSINPDEWTPFERNEGPSLWGHERYWASDEIRAKAKQKRMENGELGRRAPVQVMEGNYQLADGACPWWDSIKADVKK